MNSRILMHYQLGMDGTLAKNRHCDELWRNIGVIGPSIAFGSIGSYLVALIVLLRFLMIKRPMSYGSVHEAVSRIGCITIWVLVFLISSIKFIVSLPSTFNRNIFNAVEGIESYGLLIAPILLTVIIYVMLLCTLNPQTAAGSATGIRMRELVKMTYGVVIGLIVCNVPALLYTTIMRTQGYDMESNIAV